MPAVPITVRQLEAIVRVSESLARMQLFEEASEVHVRKAIELFTASTMDALNSGIVDFAVRVRSATSLAIMAVLSTA